MRLKNHENESMSYRAVFKVFFMCIKSFVTAFDTIITSKIFIYVIVQRKYLLIISYEPNLYSIIYFECECVFYFGTQKCFA